MNEDITPEIARMAEAMDRLVWFIDFELFADGSDMTFREAHNRIRAKRAQLGVPWEVVKPYWDHPVIWPKIEQMGMAEDNKELIVSEHHLDLPVGFQFMPEYEAMLEEEIAWEDEHPDATQEERNVGLGAIVKKHVARIGTSGRVDASDSS